jgi:NADPH:quinone reductase
VPALPAVLGNEGAGVVEAVGPGVNYVSIGDRVVYADGPLGAYATARVYPADRLVRIPDDVSDAQAAASFLRGVTARMLLKEVVSLRRGDTVLFHAAAGGVGLLFTQWARALGIRVIGTVSSEEKAAVARQAGCVEVIDYKNDDFVTRVRELTGSEGVAAVFDSIGRDTFLKSLEVLRPRGALVAFGQASGSPPQFDPFLLAPKALRITWPGGHIYTASREELETSAADLFAAIRDGVLNVSPTRTYALDDIVLAHRDLENRQIIGAAVIQP